MNFDDIKKAMDDEPNDLNIPLSVKDIKSSRSAMRKIRNRLIFEVFLSISFIFLFAFIPLWSPMHDSAQKVYFLTVFGLIMGLVGWVLFQINLIRGLAINDLTSKQSIELFIIKIKSFIDGGKYLGFGIASSMCVPVIILYIGSIYAPESYTEKYLQLNIPLWQIVLIIGGILLYSLFSVVVGMVIYNKLYKEQLQKLGSIIKQF
ncbi:MAG: hypothetical protein ACK5L8_06215 [Marinicella pacifica]